jgi:hypothetical protein
MKLKYILYGVVVAATLFAGTMAYLFYADAGGVSEKPMVPVVRETAAPVSGKTGKLAIFYAGDLMGNLGPCT